MFDDRVRRLLGPVLRTPAAALDRLGIGPNLVTVAGFVISLGAAAAVAGGLVAVGMALWLASRLLDALDGAVARIRGSGTPFGGFLDITLDMASYSLMAVGFAVRQPEQWLLWLLVLVGYLLCITTVAVLSSLLERARVAVGDNDRSLQFTAGFAEAGETTVVYLVVAMAPQWATPVLIGWVIVLAATVVQRVLLARRLLDA